MTTIKTQLAKGIVTFSYTKKDGTIRIAKGTTNPTYLSTKGATPQGGTNKVKASGYTSYYDIDKSAWRCFDEGKLLEIIKTE